MRKARDVRSQFGIVKRCPLLSLVPYPVLERGKVLSSIASCMLDNILHIRFKLTFRPAVFTNIATSVLFLLRSR
jgi:hypothetical protein